MVRSVALVVALSVASLVAASPASAAPAADPTVDGHVPVIAEVERIAGVDRYDTAAALATRVRDDTVIVATGESFPDALSAAAAGHPVLLVQRAVVPDATAAELARRHPAKIVIVGGTAAISSKVALALSEYASIDRLAGRDRYATAMTVAAWAFPGGSAGAYLADGRSFRAAFVTAAAAVHDRVPLLLVNRAVEGPPAPDATAGVVLANEDSYADSLTAATLGRPLFLVPKTCVPDATRRQLEALAPPHITLLGGPAALDDAVGELRSCTLPDDVTLDVGADVTAAQRAYIREGIDATRRLWGDGGPLLVQGYNDVDELIAANVRTHGGTVDYWRDLWSDATARGGSGWIGIKLDVVSGWDSSAYFMAMVAHEYAHNLQLPAGHPEIVVPEWFLEGGAEWIAVETWTAEGWSGWDEPAWRLEQARAIKAPLTSFVAESDTSDQGEYRLGYAGAEYLEQISDRDALLAIFHLVLGGMTWDAALERRAGVTPAEFYAGFARWLAS